MHLKYIVLYLLYIKVIAKYLINFNVFLSKKRDVNSFKDQSSNFVIIDVLFRLFICNLRLITAVYLQISFKTNLFVICSRKDCNLALVHCTSNWFVQLFRPRQSRVTFNLRAFSSCALSRTSNWRDVGSDFNVVCNFVRGVQISEQELRLLAQTWRSASSSEHVFWKLERFFPDEKMCWRNLYRYIQVRVHWPCYWFLIFIFVIQITFYLLLYIIKSYKFIEKFTGLNRS